MPAQLRETLISDLKTIAGIRGAESTPLHRRVFQADVDGRSYIHWLADRVRTFKIGPCGAVALACYRSAQLPFGLGSASREIRFPEGSGYAEANLPSRLGLLIHEARHADTKHVKCKSVEHFASEADLLTQSIGFQQRSRGDENCDANETGSYGTSIIFLRNLELHCHNCNWLFEELRVVNQLHNEYSINAARMPIEAQTRFEKDLFGTAIVLEASRNLDLPFLLTWLPRGLKAQEVDRNGLSTLHYAAMFAGKTSSIIEGVVRLLISSGANANATDDRGRTPLMYAVLSDAPHDFMGALIAGGADTNIKDNTGRSALMYAFSKGSKYRAKYLLSKGATLQVRDNLGRGPLDVAPPDFVETGRELIRASGRQGRL